MPITKETTRDELYSIARDILADCLSVGEGNFGPLTIDITFHPMGSLVCQVRYNEEIIFDADVFQHKITNVLFLREGVWIEKLRDYVAVLTDESYQVHYSPIDDAHRWES